MNMQSTVQQSKLGSRRVVLYIAPSLLLGFMVFFSLGAYYGTSIIPRTLFTKPVMTLQMMKHFPLGKSVLPINSNQARSRFEPLGWWNEPAIIIGYENIKLRGEDIIVCQIRTQRGKGYILSVNPTWIDYGRSPKE